MRLKLLPLIQGVGEAEPGPSLDNGQLTMENMISSYSGPSVFAILGGIIGAYLNSQGLDLVAVEPSIIPGILIGVMVSVFFFGGVSVGPIMAAGITALLVRVFLR